MKTNKKPIQKHQSKTMLLFKTYKLQFEFDRHLEHMASYQRMQSGFPVFLVGKFGALEVFMQSLIFHISPTANIKNRSYLDRI